MISKYLNRRFEAQFSHFALFEVPAGRTSQKRKCLRSFSHVFTSKSCPAHLQSNDMALFTLAWSSTLTPTSASPRRQIGKSCCPSRHSSYSSSSTSPTSQLPPLQSCSERPESGSSAPPLMSVSTARNSILDPSSSTKQQASGIAVVGHSKSQPALEVVDEPLAGRAVDLLLVVVGVGDVVEVCVNVKAVDNSPPQKSSGLPVVLPTSSLSFTVVCVFYHPALRTECEFPPRLSGTHSVW